MGIAEFIGFAVGMMFNPTTAGGILLVGILSNNKKTAFSLGLIWGAVVIGQHIYTFQQIQIKIYPETYFVPFASGLLALIIAWVKSGLFRRGEEKLGKAPPISEDSEIVQKRNLLLDPIGSTSPDETSESNNTASQSEHEDIKINSSYKKVRRRHKLVFAGMFSWMILVAIADPSFNLLHASELELFFM